MLIWRFGGFGEPSRALAAVWTYSGFGGVCLVGLFCVRGSPVGDGGGWRRQSRVGLGSMERSATWYQIRRVPPKCWVGTPRGPILAFRGFISHPTPIPPPLFLRHLLPSFDRKRLCRSCSGMESWVPEPGRVQPPASVARKANLHRVTDSIVSRPLDWQHDHISVAAACASK